MSLRNGLIIFIIISILMAKFKTAKGRIHEGKHKGHREVNTLNYQSLQTRHYNHYLHKKHHKCNFDRSYYGHGTAKKPSRYPTLDKIVHRLDRAEKPKTSTTRSPFDEWNGTGAGAAPATATATAPATFAEKAEAGGFGRGALGLGVGVANGTRGKGAARTAAPAFRDEGAPAEARAIPDRTEYGFPARGPPPFGGGPPPAKDDGDDNSVDGHFSVFTTGFMQDHTTSGPWENEQHDVSSRAGENAKDPGSSISTLSTPFPLPSEGFNFDKLPFWSISRLVSKASKGDDRKKQTTSLPYVAAHEHYEQVLRLGDCHTPKEKVIRVHEVHPDPSKSYSPSCTILHQCGDDTGCCRDLKQVCKPKNTTKVELYFFTTTLGKPQTIEKLHFVNHTECECQKRTEEVMPQDSNYLGVREDGEKEEEKKREKEEKKENCNCPKKYSARFFVNESCICDCFDKQDDCLILKKGKAHFSYQDKLCIQQGKCRLPSCEYGSYIRQFGRCPNRSEKYHLRWNKVLSYRDLIT